MIFRCGTLSQRQRERSPEDYQSHEMSRYCERLGGTMEAGLRSREEPAGCRKPQNVCHNS